MSARGTWEVRAAYDPMNLSASDKVAIVTETTFNHHRVPMNGESTHLSVRFRSIAPADTTTPAKLGSVVLHHDLDNDED